MACDMTLPWPTSIPQLKRLDELLRCGICYDFMSTSMVTACSHNYCSLCIRQYLDYKTQCPACFSETTSQQLRNNRLLDEIIGLFPSLRDKIAKICHTSKRNSITSYLENKEQENEDSADANINIPNTSTRPQEDVTASPRRAISMKDFMSPKKSKTVLDTPKRNLGKALSSGNSHTPVRGSQLESSTSSSFASQSTKASAKSPATIFGSQLSPQPSLSQSPRPTASGHFSIRPEGPTANGGQGENKVKCPVCCVEVPERNINIHLDACLKQMEGGVEEIQVVRNPKRKALPKLVYSLLSEKQLRQKLKELNLSIQGDKPVLVARHRRYTTLYNAECDVANPRPVSELVRQVEREEREETKAAGSRSIFTYDRKTAPEIIEKEQATYVKKNQDHFAKLIAEVKKRKAEAKRAKEAKSEQSEGATKPEDTSDSPNNHSKDNSDQIINNLHEDNTKDKEDVKELEPCSSKRKSFSLCNNNIMMGVTFPSDEIPQRRDSDNSKNCVINDSTNPLPDKISNNKNVENGFESSKMPDKTTNTVATSNDSTAAFKNKELNSEDSTVQPSPDFFSASPSGSQSSCESFSLLQDCDTVPDHSPEFAGFNMEEKDDDIIPGHQPESCSDDDQEYEKTPSPQVGKRSTRSTTAVNKPAMPDLTELGPETQNLLEDSQGDPDYLPSQLLDDMDMEDMDFQPLSSQTRRSTRKRKVAQEVTTRTTRKKKR